MEHKIGVIGLGYVGLPLAVQFSTKFNVIGYDIDERRISRLRSGIDDTREISDEKLAGCSQLYFSTDKEDLKGCNILIITVPTPIDQFKNPDLKPLLTATELAASVLNQGDIVIYESTVYPGCTEEECVPILEKLSGLTYNQGFYCGYSPERINPGDKQHTIEKIIKVTSGSTPEIAEIVDQLYKSIIMAGTHKTSSIRVAEASKVIENAQRDINIAFVNELAMLFDLLDLDTNEVLDAAGTKWNFLNFKPGLVGGHCIGVDPYYLMHKAENVGYHPEVILSGRRINDNMGKFVANKFIKLLVKNEIKVSGARVLLLGITFKENCPDIRNSMVIDIIKELKGFGVIVDVFDSEAVKEEVKAFYGIDLIENLNQTYEGIIHAVEHSQFKKIDYSSISNKNTVIYDVKSSLPRSIAHQRL
jgi:UDP-N-acetyl-D-glucosamine/UDP-N-acetyl-D-galactosamine dehydrogenase